jgi:hypothetical protein
MKLTVSIGHGEYGSHGTVKRRELWDPHDESTEELILAERDDGDDDFRDDDHARAAFAKAYGSAAAVEDWDFTWEIIEEWEGTPEEFRQEFEFLMNDLRIPPSGDDTTFDYWPSGVRLAQQLGEALDECHGVRHGYRERVDALGWTVLAEIGMDLGQFAYLELRESDRVDYELLTRAIEAELESRACTCYAQGGPGGSDPDCELHYPNMIENDGERELALRWWLAGRRASTEFPPSAGNSPDHRGTGATNQRREAV